jgi:hypothetical protein
MKKLLAMISVGLALTGCTVVKVRPIDGNHRVENICIINNPRVTVPDFVPVMQEGFGNHGISSQLVTNRGGNCEYTATYNARRSWDIGTYLSVAQIWVQRNGQQIANADYHLKNKGGLALNKWASVRSKMLPVIEQLLVKLPKGGGGQIAAAQPAAQGTPVQATNADPPATSELAVKLAHLKDAHDAGLITKEEHDAKRKELLEKL